LRGIHAWLSAPLLSNGGEPSNKRCGPLLGESGPRANPVWGRGRGGDVTGVALLLVA
jgi:hypothetical protein